MLTCVVSAWSQTSRISKSSANQLYQYQDYYGALEQYLALLKSESDNVEYNFRTAVCYLKTNIDKGQAVPYLLNVVNINYLAKKEPEPIVYYLLGRAYHHRHEFDEAIEMYEKFLKFESINESDRLLAQQKLQFSYNAKELVKFPIDITFTNMGKEVNSPYPDYFPFVPSDESYMVYNSKRPDSSAKIPNGSWASNIYLSIENQSKFESAGLLKSVNTVDENEDIIGLSADGKKALFFIDNEYDYGDLFIADFNSGKIDNLHRFEKELLSAQEEIAASVTNDGNTIFIASNREGGFGGVDIYVSKKLPDGTWGKPMNLGPEINTPYDEDFPNISPDGKTLYFSSEGHASMGGLDIFKARLNEKTGQWVGVKNMGYPLNNTEDNMNFRVSENGKYGYMSAVRPDGYGDLDIYRINFNEVDPRYTIVTGKLYSVNTTQIKDDIFITVFDAETDEVYGEYLPNPNTGKYVLIVPPGKYVLALDVEGFHEVSEEFEILDKASYQTYIHQDLVLKPKDILMRLPTMDL